MSSINWTFPRLSRARAEAEKKGRPPEPAKPERKDQYNFTDPAHHAGAADGFVRAYKAQIAVEQEFQLIVGQAVTQAAKDKEQLREIVKTIKKQSGQTPKQILADRGYGSEKVLETFEHASAKGQPIDLCIAIRREKHGESPEPCKRGS